MLKKHHEEEAKLKQKKDEDIAKLVEIEKLQKEHKEKINKEIEEHRAQTNLEKLDEIEKAQKEHHDMIQEQIKV